MEGIISHLMVLLVFILGSVGEGVFDILVGFLCYSGKRALVVMWGMHLSRSLILSLPVPTIGYLHRKGVHFLKVETKA
jgi:hypothetical protein